MADRPYRSPLPPLLRDWDDGTIVYNPLSGATHRLDPISAEVLARVALEPMTAVELAGVIFSDGAPADGQDPVKIIAAALTQMDHLGLVEEVAP